MKTIYLISLLILSSCSSKVMIENLDEIEDIAEFIEDQLKED